LFVWLVGVPGEFPLAIGTTAKLPVYVVAAGAAIWIVGVVNMTNFMDGMDGLAGTQTIGTSLALGVALLGARHTDLAIVAFFLAAAAGGFLVQNAPPARIFMGDAGSMFVGFQMAALPVVAVGAAPALPLSLGPLALAPFLLDATYTLFRRVARRERFWVAHKTHLYQRAVETGLTHREVLLPYAAWIVAAAASAVVAARSGAAIGLVCAAVNVAGFFAVMIWVRGLEAKK
jgi:Fuc2NAc and GlcNAc transferase